MSGGALDYIGYKINDVVSKVPDRELRDMIKDVAGLLHDLEWYLSGDTSEGAWLLSANKFRVKWLRNDGKERLKGYLDEYAREDEGTFKHLEEMIEIIGMSFHCIDCKYFLLNMEKGEKYGKCKHTKSRLLHFYSRICERFIGKDD